MKTIRFIDLFCGMGGMRIGFENALDYFGLTGEAVFASEIKEHALEAYSRNFNHVDIDGDITKINEYMIPDFEVLLAGFPCQAFSYAGKKLGFEDARGTLFFDIARIVQAKQPLAFLLENVEGLVSHNNGKTLDRMLSILTELGYFISYAVLDGKDFGLAQTRKRLYMCGLKSGQRVSFDNFDYNVSDLSEIIEYNIGSQKTEFTEKLLSYFKLEEVTGKQIKDKRGGKNNIHSWEFGLKGLISQEQKKLLSLLLKHRRNKKWADIIGIEWMDGMPLSTEMIRTFYDNENLSQMLDDLVEKKYLVLEYPKKKIGNRREYDTSLKKGYNIVTGKLSFEFSNILDPKGIAPTIVATDALKLGVPVCRGIRTLTVREGLRLFGFPESYDLNFLGKTEAFDLLGNTVCVPVVREIAKRLIKMAFYENTGGAESEATVIRAAI